MRFTRIASLVLSLTMLAASVNAATPSTLDPENTLYLQLRDGRVVIQLRPDLAPNHVKRIKELTRQGFYDGLKFHRVIDGFMAQTGDPTGTGAGGSKLPDLNAEFNSAKHIRGTVSMARTQNPNSANSQFFICFKPSPFLDGQYTVFGQVVEGMQYVDNIKKGEQGSGTVTDPDKIISMRVAADVDAKTATPAASGAPAGGPVDAPKTPASN